MTYNPWPIGKVPVELQRVELRKVREAGYFYQDPRELVKMFEHKVALFTGARYAVSVDCCTHALELCMRYKIETEEINVGSNVLIPENTYVSVPMMLLKCGLSVKFEKIKWEGLYELQCGGMTRVIDAAVRWREKMYLRGTMMCLSFQIKKRIPIGRGGMILTDDKEAYEWLKLMRYDGRDLDLPYTHPDHVKAFGFHYYMTPEDAARGILLMDTIKERGDSGTWENYPNLQQWLKL